MRQICITRAGVKLGHMWGEIDRMREWGDQLFELYQQRAIKPKIAASFRFDEAAKAHHFIQDRRNIGKVLLVPCRIIRPSWPDLF